MESKILVFASGTAIDGGFRFSEIMKNIDCGIIKASVVGVVSNHENGGVRKIAELHSVPFTYFPGPFDAKNYQRIAKDSGADFFSLSGWLKKVEGLDLKTKFNSKTVFGIYPGPLPRFSGKGMNNEYYIYEAVIEAFKRGEIKKSAVSMYFVIERYHYGPIFATIDIPISSNDTADTLRERTINGECGYQSIIMDMVADGSITWDGINKDSLKDSITIH